MMPGNAGGASGSGIACNSGVYIVFFLQERIQADEVIAILDQERQGRHNINPKDEL